MTSDRFDRIVPPGVADARGRAFARMLARALDAVPPAGVFIDVDTVPAELLPSLVRSLSCQEFITDAMPEAMVRGVLKRWAELHRTKGTDAGVVAGLAALGFDAQIEQWWQASPMGAPNTHTITVAVASLSDEMALLDPRNRAAARRMISATKRHSQSSTIRFLLQSRAAVRVGALARTGGLLHTLAKAPQDQLEQSRVAMALVSRLGGTFHTRGLGAPT